MYKVLIVDDEAIICQGLRSKLRRINNTKIHKILECYSAEEAMIMIRKHKPDIVITDVKMPGMNGIQLIEKIMIENEYIKFIVLSGYDNYQYVRQAFKNGAVDYILKPASLDELRGRIDTAIQMIEIQEHEKEQEDAQNRKQINHQAREVMEKIIHGQGEAHHIKDRLDTLYPNLYMQIAIIYHYTVPQIPWVKEEFNLLLDEVLQSYKHLSYAYYYNHKDELVILFNYQESEGQRIVREVTKKMMTILRNKNMICVSSMSSSAMGEEKFLGVLYQEALEALSYKIIYEPYEIISYEQLQKSRDTIILHEGDIDILEDYIQQKNCYKLSHFINQYFTHEKLQHASIASIQKLYRIILQKINQLFNNNDLVRRDVYNKDFKTFESLVDIRVYLKQSVLYIQQEITEKDQQVKTVVDIATQYIHDHYSEDISMYDVANMVSMNYSYFSKLFKEHMQISFKKYLVKIRMEHAKTLLQNPKKRIQEVANSVGYDNPQNFSRAFKTYYGYSPKEFRENNS